MKKRFNKFLTLLAVLLFGFGQMWGALTTHQPGVYTKATGEGGYGLTLASYNPGDGARNYEVYYFSWKSSKMYLGAGSSYVTNSSAYCLINGVANNTTDGVDFGWGNVISAGLSGSNTSPAAEWAVANASSSTHYVPLTSSSSLTIKISGYDQFSFAGRDNHASTSGKQFVVTIDGVAQDFAHSASDWNIYRFDITTEEHTIVVTGNGTDANRLRCFSLRLPAPSCSTEITTQPSGATLAVGDANPTLSVVATNAASYAWKESSDGTSYDGGSALASTASFTPEVNDAVQTKYYYCEVTSDCDGTTVVKSNIVTVNVVGAITYYTVTLVPAGGTISDATGWTLNAGNYEKEVAAGTELTLPTFTKENRNFKTWRKAGPADVASPVTVNSDLALTAVWTATIENVIYSWEGAEGGATEVGGTAAGSEDGLINIESAGYYTLKINGKADWSTQKVEITLSGDEKVKTGDKIKYWGFYVKDQDKSARPKMRDGNSPNAAIFDDPTNLPNLYDGTGSPAERTFTVPADINTNKVQITRSQTGSNTWISKLQIIRETQVEEGDLLTVTFNSNGGSSIDPVLVASGQTVAKPADPTKAHNRFNGWKLAGSAYNFATPVTSNITLDADWTPLYTISFAAGDGSGDAPAAVPDKAQGETFEVPANTFTAPASKEFDKWNDGSADYAPGATYTVGTANVVLTAQWKAAVAKYTVIFKDGETTLDTKLFDVGSNPSDAGIDKTKALFTFAAWQKEGVDIAMDDAFWATVVKDATVTLNARWIKAYATDVDFETEAVGHAGDEDYAKSIVDAHNYALSTKTGTTFDENTSTNNGAYLGLKIKNAGTTLSWNVVAGKVVELKAGVMVANGSLAINGGAATEIDGGSTGSGDNFKIHYFYSATEALYEFTTSNGSAEVIKAITMRDPYTVSFEAHGDADPSALPGQPSVTLPNATNGTASLLGWFDAETGGNKIGDAGASYIPTANITLHAQWESVSTDARLSSISFSSAAGTLEPAFDPEVVNYTYTMPYPTAAVPTITGATSVSAKAKTPVIDAQAANWGDVAHIHGVAESDDTKDYYITMKIAPKDPVCLVWADIPSANTLTYNASKSLLAEDAVTLAINNVSGTDGPAGVKFQKKGYIKIEMNEGTFQAGDVVALDVTGAAGSTMHVFKVQTPSSEADVIGTGEGSTTPVGVNKVAIIEDAAALYLARPNDGTYNGWNPHVDYVAVYRAYPAPLLTAITIDGASGSISGTAVNVTIPAVSVLESLTVVPTFISNDPTQTNGNVISNEGAWVLGENTYRVTDKDGDYTDYTISLAQDVAIESVTISGETTLAAKSQITLTATVLPAAAINKNVTWTSSDETKATVDANGVVTGKAVGNVTITATSVADNTKYGTHDITVTKFIGTEYAYWFAKAADATANGVANDDGTIFEGAPTDGSNLSASLTMEVSGVETTYTVTRRSGDDGFGTFHVPADFTANLYMLVIGSGSPRTLTLKETSTNAEYASIPATFGDQATQIVFENIPSGDYSFDKHSQSIRVALMVAELNSYPITSVSLESGFNLRLGNSRTPVITVDPVKAAIASQEWSVVSKTGASDATLNTTTGVVTAGTEEGTMTVKVTVTDVLGNELASGNCVVNIVNIIDQQPVTGSVTWDWNALSMSKTTITDEEVLVLANYINGDKWAMLKGTKGDNAYNTTANGSYEGKGTLSFTTTVPGLVTITARSWNNSPNLKIGDQAVINSLSGSTKVSKPFFVPAGEVVISASNENDGMRIMKIEFDADLTADKVAGSFFEGYTRDVTEGKYGTICLPTNGVMIGTTIYTLAFYGATSQKIFFDEVVTGRMEAGKPYLFLPEQGVTELKVFYTDSETKTAQTVNGFHGYIGDSEDPEDALPVPAGEGNYIVQNNTYREVQAGATAYILSHRAYIKFSEISPTEPAKAPGARRIGLGKDAAQGFENLQSGDQPMKVMIDGTLYIIRGEKVYNANGQVVK